MKAAAPAILYALFVWWFSTGLVLMLVLRPKAKTLALAGAALLFPVCLVALAVTSRHASVPAVYAAFTAAIALWGTQEVAFLTGVLTGPRPKACPPDARGFDRFCFAVCAILYHEIALIVTGAAVLVVTWDAPNKFGSMTFLVLWLLRLSAKFNLFFGVPVLNDDVLPAPIVFIRSYFRRGPANGFLPISMILSLLCTWTLVDAGLDANTTTVEEVGDFLVAGLLGLAILEHVFMLVPLPVDRLWRWSTARATAGVHQPVLPEPSARELDRVVPTRL